MRKYSLALMLFTTIRVLGAPFENLDFENAITNSLRDDPKYSGLIGSVADLLPGWELFHGTNLVTSVSFNPPTFSIRIEGGAAITASGWGMPPLEGNYSLSLLIPGGFNPDPYTLIQRGDIPADAKFLAFTYRYLPFAVSIDGTQVTPFGIPGGFTSPRTFFVDISRFAGQEVELSFKTIGTPTSGATGSHDLDAIAFLVPEPSAWALLCLGGVALLWPRIRRRPRQ